MQFVPPAFMNLYTLRDMRDAHLSSLLLKVYHKWTREMWVYIHTVTPSSDSNVVFIPRSHTKISLEWETPLIPESYY